MSTIITLATLPFVVSELGLASYGLFSLLGVVTGYVGILDLGFSWSATRFLTEAIEHKDDARTKRILSASLVFHLAVGVVGLAVLGGLAYPLTHWVFDVPAQLEHDGTLAALIFAAAFPFTMLQALNTAAFRGARRFDYATVGQIFSGAGTGLLIVAALAAGGTLVAVCAVVAAVQMVVAAGGMIFVRRIYGDAYALAIPERAVLVSLARFSFATSISSIASNLLYLPNRLAVGVLLPLHTAGLFSIPLAIAQRMLVIPNTVVTAALPSLTAAVARQDEREFWRTARRTLTWVLVLLVPLLLWAIVWAPEILREWLGITSADAALVTRLSLAAVLLNAVTSVYSVLCDSVGAPHIPAVASVVAGVTNASLAFLLTATSGMAGAALALPVSVTILGLVMYVLWRRSNLLRPAAYRVSSAAVSLMTAVGLATLGFVIGLVAVREHVDSLTSLVGIGALFLGCAYAVAGAAVVAIALRRRGRDGEQGSYA